MEIAWDASPAAGTRKSFVFNGVEFAFRYCPPGTFPMGGGEAENERDAWDRRATPRQVTLASGFWLAETPTTQAQYVALTGTNPSFFSAEERNRSWEGKPILNALRRYLDATGGDFGTVGRGDSFQLGAWASVSGREDEGAPECKVGFRVALGRPYRPREPPTTPELSVDA